MATEVSLSRCNTYDRDVVLTALSETLGRLGGMAAFVQPGHNVLLKPSLLRPAPSERCVTTHPSVVWAVASLVQQAGGMVYVGDSPGVGSGRKAMRASGIWEVVEELGLRVADFKQSVELSAPEGHTFKRFEIARDVLQADVMINLPKVKTHGQMYLTLAVKNIFGCIVGVRKPQWHLKAGSDTRYFARMLLDLYVTVRPALTIVDGIVGMEGNGPGSGDPRKLGFLLAGEDGVAIDRVVCALLQLPAESLHTNVEARRLGIGETDLHQIRVLGEPLDRMRVPHFRPAETADLHWTHLPEPVIGAVRNLVTPRPRIVHSLCTRCGQCLRVCPTNALSLESSWQVEGGARVKIRYLVCIRCLCCQELCPEGAIRLESNWLLKKMAKR